MAAPPLPVALLPEDVYRRALEVGRLGAGITGPNPPVGCVIVRDGEVVGRGTTQGVGGAHAEVVALREAGDAAAGATAVVSLEPCAHHGRTPPCVDSLVAAGIREVHVLLRDPDPVAAGGISALAASGIAVLDVGEVRPDLAAAAAHDLRGFLTRVRHGRPHVILKLAQDTLGRTVPPTGGYLTGVDARRRVHALRADSDAVLVGGGTVRADDPRLDVRLVESRREPRPILVSTRGTIDAGARAVRPGTIVLTGAALPSAEQSELASRGAEVVAVPLDREGRGLDLTAALARLLDHRILTVLAEPGPRLAAALLDADLVDVVELHVARGADAGPLRPALPALAALMSRGPGVARTETVDGDLVLRADRLVLAARPDPLHEVA